MKLRTLGGLELLGARFTQPKPLLLLAYLTLEGPQRRRHLAELFWGDGNRMKSLSMTLTRLRQGAGEVLGTDDKRLWATLESDVGALFGALDRGDWEGASRLYTGAFLEGVVGDGWGSELEEWVYVTREHLAQRTQHALLSSAEGAAKRQDFHAAATLAARAYRLPGLGGHEVVTLQRLYPLLCAGDSVLAPEVRREAEGYGVALRLTSQKARATFGLQGPATALPLRGTSFVGRDLELTELATRLGRANVALLTLLGPAGVGKTRLALQLAHEQLRLGAFGGGVYFVALDALSSARQLPPRLVGELGLRQTGKVEPLEQLVDFIAERAVLLVLDNFEQLEGGAELLPPLLRRCPNLKLLVTSRERLRLEEEYVFPLAGLPYPQTATPEAGLSDAVKLFNERARQVQPHFDPVQARPSVIDICRLVEGSPLGLELAAGWAGSLTCAEIAEEIRGHLEFLSSTTRNLPERHRSLKAAFESSWQRLSAREQAVLRRLSVFFGGFTRTAAAAVTGATLPVLASLVDKSVLRRLPDGRYDRHPLLYEFTREKLADHPDEQAQTRARYLDFYLELAEAAEAQLEGREPARWFQRLGEEADNFRQAFSYLEASGDAETALRLATALGLFWTTRGPYAEGSRYLTAFLTETTPSPVRAKALLLAGELAFLQSDPSGAQTLLEQSLALAQTLDDPSLWAKSLRSLGHVAHHHRSDAGGARALYLAALERAEKGGDRATAAAALRSLGGLNNDQANYQDARRCYEEALALSAALGDPHSCAKTLVSLASVLIPLGEPGRAEALNRESLELFRAVGDSHGEGIALLNLGVGSADRGDLSGALSRYRESLELFRRLGDRRMVSHLLNNLASCLRQQGSLAEARPLLEESLAVQRTVGDTYLTAQALNILGRVCADQGDAEAAYSHYQACRRLCLETGDNWTLMRVLVALGRWQLERRAHAAAHPLLLEAAELAHRCGDLKLLIQGLELRARLEAEVGTAARAAQFLAFTETLRQRSGFARAPREQGDYEALLGHLSEQLGAEVFGRAYARGSALERAVAVRMGRDFARASR